MPQDDPWSLDAANQPARTEPKVEPQAPTSLEDALLALDHKSAPVFAVLDGAQFDNLPQELLLGDFVSRPLYLDRGDNNPELIITAPHMVWLDERPEKITGRAPQDTIPALLALIANRPAAVFWQCPDGADALYHCVPVGVCQRSRPQLLGIHVGLHGQHTVYQLLLRHFQ